MDIQEVGSVVMNWIELAQDKDRWRALCECGNELSGTIKCGEFLDYLKPSWLLKKDCAPCRK
jgi:phenylalanine-4-hydroxylase